MTRGLLHVYLGAAPGVGKTFTMLEEGRRMHAAGHDVVIGVVETHGRAATAALVEGLEVLPRRRVEHRAVTLDEFDVSALIARKPEWALIDELAHTNAPGSLTPKRFADVALLLDAGINVMSTVNIQHIESLHDVVEQITGIAQNETIADSVLRSADQIELVDLAPEALRARLSGGFVYPAGTIDAALSNYFRLGNLTALRELALLWLADEVDVALTAYRAEHGIGQKWEARERVVVALPGGAEGETLIRRGARIAARSSGGELLAVHVSGADGLAAANPGALAQQRTLVEQLGGHYHHVVGDDTPQALVDFARGVNATQLVVGVSRRSRLTALLTGAGIGATVIRESGDIDVHIVTHAAAGSLALPRLGGALTLRRQWAGGAIAVLGLSALTWAMAALRTDDSITSEVLLYQLLVVIVALVGGLRPAVPTAVAAGLLLDYFFVSPLYTVTIADPRHFLALLVFLVVAVLVSVVVDSSARRSRAARRSAAEAETLATVAGSVLRGQDALQALIDRLREVFSLERVTLESGGEVLYEAAEHAAAEPLAAEPIGRIAPDSVTPLVTAAETAVWIASGDGVHYGTAPNGAAHGSELPDGLAHAQAQASAAKAPEKSAERPGDATHADTQRTAYPLSESAQLVVVGRPLQASDRRILAAFLSQIESALVQRRLAAEAESMRPLEQADRMRTALLAAVGHDLRTPLSSATAAVSSLASSEVDWSDVDRCELLRTAEESLVTLAELVNNLLDVSRLQAGVLAVSRSEVGLDEVVPLALDELHVAPGAVVIDVSPALPPVVCDPALLQRVIVNLLSNALRYSPAGTQPIVGASAFGDTVQLRIIDRGPGIPPERLTDAFQPFQRLGDTDNTTGVGLGLALSRGFVEAMNGTLEAEDTPGGGLTMVITLPRGHQSSAEGDS
ncbi:ATP-binding protein [Subtercola lobariae]|uniref:histidine kinase n=1 Tax=Subtercola lobariae TaxID=1588641 RepID=A0A917B5S0_9MICO|nr:ATP-binding protein [Subtercola lobariae]GGF24306.1 hypothetical protein GCM10011399_17310 [Subtercola lobariae]